MNKTELIDTLAETSGQTKTTAAAILNALIETVQTEVAAGREVQIVGFGAFKRGFVPGRITKNMHTQAPLTIEDTWTPKFKAGDDFKRAVKATPVAA